MSAKKHHDADSKIISIHQLATGRIFLATEKRLYELMEGAWHPMTFMEPAPPEPEPATASSSGSAHDSEPKAKK